jgi:hypothetical protein
MTDEDRREAEALLADGREFVARALQRRAAARARHGRRLSGADRQLLRRVTDALGDASRALGGDDAETAGGG